MKYLMPVFVFCICSMSEQLIATETHHLLDRANQPVFSRDRSCIQSGMANQPMKPFEVCGDIVDDDGDGVNDSLDRCPKTLLGAPVDSKGCYLDSDEDGVADYRDVCPGTNPKVKRVDSRGCPGDQMIRYPFAPEFYFNFDSAKLSSDTKKGLEFLSEEYYLPKLSSIRQIKIFGHTDSLGSETYNQKLSEKRAQTVANKLIQLGVPKEKILVIGWGEERPVSTNRTNEGRAKNRRVEISVSPEPHGGYISDEVEYLHKHLNQQ